MLHRPLSTSGAFENVRPWLWNNLFEKCIFFPEVYNLEPLNIGMGCKNIKFLIICIEIVVLLMQHNYYCIIYTIHGYMICLYDYMIV